MAGVVGRILWRTSFLAVREAKVPLLRIARRNAARKRGGLLGWLGGRKKDREGDVREEKEEEKSELHVVEAMEEEKEFAPDSGLRVLLPSRLPSSALENITLRKPLPERDTFVPEPREVDWWRPKEDAPILGLEKRLFGYEEESFPDEEEGLSTHELAARRYAWYKEQRKYKGDRVHPSTLRGRLKGRGPLPVWAPLRERSHDLPMGRWQLMKAAMRGDVGFLEDAIEEIRSREVHHLGGWLEEAARDLEGATLMHIAAAACQESVVKMLLELEHSPSMKTWYGQTPMHAAAESGAAAIIHMLHDAGADCNVQTVHGVSPLARSVARGWVEASRALLDRGADVAVVDDLGKSPLHEAVSRGRVECVKMLLEAGASPNVPDVLGQTPTGKLHFAGDRQGAAMVKDLAANGAKLNAVDLKGRPPAWYLSLHGRFRTWIKLVDAGAKPVQADRQRRSTKAKTKGKLRASNIGQKDFLSVYAEHGV